MTVRETHYDPQERDIVVAAQRGDRAAFKTLYDLYRDRVYNLIYYALGDELWAEDVLQIVFIKIYKGLPNFRFEAAIATWIYRIVINECLNQQQRRGAQYVPFEAILGSDEEFDPDMPPDLQHADNERREIVHQAVMDLSPKLRAVIVLKYLEGLSYEEIAATLDCAPGTVASRLNRALSELETRLRPLKKLL